MIEPVETLDAIREHIERACAKVGRTAAEVTLIAVSKTRPAELINPYYLAGQRHFGENKLQELAQKAPALPAEICWHFIGTLQRNKVRKVLVHANCIHSIDSLKLAQAVSRIAQEEGKTVEIFLQVNVGQEDSKGGFLPAELPSDMPELRRLPNLTIRGLMSIPPAVSHPEEARPYFQKLRALRDVLRESFELPLPDLSMGMSHDYQVAVEEGATHVRVGSALFGERAPR